MISVEIIEDFAMRSVEIIFMAKLKYIIVKKYVNIVEKNLCVRVPHLQNYFAIKNV
jgi:hypothetical protein